MSAPHAAAGHAPVTLRGYLTGFALAVVLTAVPFWLVMSHVLPGRQLTAFIIVGFAAVQIVVHMIYFLHMTTRAEEGWSLTALVFTVILVVITLAGSTWVLYHLNTNMMPSHPVSELP
ncbi:MAG: cytochrome o ubiquinol oxidase subunit IV [Steroidobacteraceae bacterium]